jgi:hypothetical protein
MYFTAPPLTASTASFDAAALCLTAQGIHGGKWYAAAVDRSAPLRTLRSERTEFTNATPAANGTFADQYTTHRAFD